jgi:hypothetical protein
MDRFADKFTFGKEYRDTITGFKGFCTGRCEYVSGCNQVLLMPAVDKDGKAVDGHWIDEDRLAATGKGKRYGHDDPKGGPQSNTPAAR